MPRPDDEKEVAPPPKRVKKVPERMRISAQLMKGPFFFFEKVAEVNPYFKRKWAICRTNRLLLEAADMTQYRRERRAPVL